MKMKRADETAKIRQAYVNAVPDICAAILSDCKQEKGQVTMMEETKKKRKTVKYLLAAAACLILVSGGGLGFNTYRLNHRVVSTVSLEVNPSVQILVNEKERVLDVRALNKDGEIVIGDMDFSGSDINVTVNALIGSMLRNGYLNELANSILISVDNEDPVKGAALQEKLTKEVNELLESDGFMGAVLSQTISGNTSLQEQADQYGITPGKAQLIGQILENTKEHTFEELAPLSINELNLILSTAGSGADRVSASGNASDKAYIGREKALKAALTHAGVSEADIAFYKMDMDVENGVMVYEIDFYCGGYEYEYDIDAGTGEIVKNRKEIDDDALAAPDEKFILQPSDSVNDVEDHYFGSYSSDNDHHSEPDHNGMYYGGETYREDPHHDGAYYNGSGAGTGSGADSSASITVDQAKEIALKHAGQTADAVYFEKAKQDYDDGVLVYEIEFIAGDTEYEYEINARTGDIVKNKREAADTPQNGNAGGSGNTGNAGNTAASITVDQAKEIALNHAGQTADAVYFKKAEQDYDDGVLVYEIEFLAGGTEYEYEIDAQTGAIRDYEWDYD